MDAPTFDDPKIEAIYQAGLRYIERVRAANRWEDGVLVMPCTCYGCAELRTDFFMMTGDGLPMCQKCFDGCVCAIREQDERLPPAGDP